MLNACLNGDEWDIQSIRVDPQARGVGIGSKLLDTFLAYVDDEFEGSRVRSVYLSVSTIHSPDELNAQQLRAWYGRHGFTVRGHRQWSMVRVGRN